MSRKTWRDLARQQGSQQPAPASPDLQQLAGQVPGLQRLLEQRDTLRQQMRRLGGQGDDSAPADRRYPVASASERRAEHAAWERQRDGQNAPAALAHRNSSSRMYIVVTPAGAWDSMEKARVSRTNYRQSLRLTDDDAELG